MQLDEVYRDEVIKWMINFVEKPNHMLNNWPPCPFARQARINDTIHIQFSDIDTLISCVNNSLPLLDTKEVVIICFDHTKISVNELTKIVSNLNKRFMENNYIILEDHPNDVEYVNNVHMNFGFCGLLIIQKADKLASAAAQLHTKGYYNVWKKEELDSIVTWR
jgi:hypothetical protein